MGYKASEKLARLSCTKVVVNDLTPTWQPVMSGIQQSSIWFAIFSNGLDDGTDCTFSKTVDDTTWEATEGN